jgi:hypothetical protein
MSLSTLNLFSHELLKKPQISEIPLKRNKTIFILCGPIAQIGQRSSLMRFLDHVQLDRHTL